MFGSDQAPRLVISSNTRLIDPSADLVDFVHEAIFLFTDGKIGTVYEGFLRLFGRVDARQLRGEATLSDADQDGRPLTWSDEQYNIAEPLLALAGLLMRVIGSNRAVGDGVCDVLTHVGHEPGDARAVKGWCHTQLGRRKGRGIPQPPATDTATMAAPVL